MALSASSCGHWPCKPGKASIQAGSDSSIRHPETLEGGRENTVLWAWGTRSPHSQVFLRLLVQTPCLPLPSIPAREAEKARPHDPPPGGREC